MLFVIQMSCVCGVCMCDDYLWQIRREPLHLCFRLIYNMARNPWRKYSHSKCIPTYRYPSSYLIWISSLTPKAESAPRLILHFSFQRVKHWRWLINFRLFICSISNLFVLSTFVRSTVMATLDDRQIRIIWLDRCWIFIANQTGW